MTFAHEALECLEAVLRCDFTRGAAERIAAGRWQHATEIFPCFIQMKTSLEPERVQFAQRWHDCVSESAQVLLSCQEAPVDLQTFGEAEEIDE